MPSIPFGLSSFERDRGDITAMPVVNMYAEAAATEEGGAVLQSRPGLEAIGIQDSLIDAVFQKDGCLDGGRYIVSGEKLHGPSGEIGSVYGNGPFFLDGFATRLFVNGGGNVFAYDGADLVLVPFPDEATVSKIIVGGSRLVALAKDTEKLYWSGPLTSEIDGLAFASAESQPDRLRDMLFIDDTLVLFGSETVEFWPNTGDPDLPFQPLEGRVFEVGIKQVGAACRIGSAFAWVTNRNQVCLQDQSTVISNEGIEERIANSEKCSLWSFLIDATEFLAISLDKETHIYCPRAGRWSTFVTHGHANWLPKCYANGVFGGSDGRLFKFGAEYQDAGAPLERRFRAVVPLKSGSVVVNNLGLRTNPGQAVFHAGHDGDPCVEVRLSRDGGQTWGNWKRRSLGERGQYRKRVAWTALGQLGWPGGMFEFRCTDQVDFRVSDVTMNEPIGGI